MAKNKLGDLNDHLFEAMERLNDDDLMSDDASLQIDRARAITGIGKTIIENGKLMLDAQRHSDEYGYGHGYDRKLPKLLVGEGDDK